MKCMDETEVLIFRDLICHNHFASREQVEECIDIAREQNGDVAQIMVAKGYVTPTKMKIIQDILAVDQSQSRLDPEQEQQLNIDLKLVEIKRLANEGRTDEAMQLFEDLKISKQYENLGQILTVKAFLAEEQKKRIAEYREEPST